MSDEETTEPSEATETPAADATAAPADAHPEDSDLHRLEGEGGLDPNQWVRLDSFSDPRPLSTHPTFFAEPTLIPLPADALITNAPVVVENPKPVSVTEDTWLDPASFLTFYRNPDTGSLHIALITGMTTVGDEAFFSIAVFYPHHYEQFGGVKVDATERGCITG